MSKIIFLLGIGSSGKSTVANEIQQLDDSYQLVGFDHAVIDLDKKYWPGGTHEQEGFHIINIMTPLGETPELRAGPVGIAFHKKMIADIIRLANEGNNLIIDTVPTDDEYQQLLSAFNGHDVLCVGIKPPVDVIIQRENKRPDRRAGTAKAAYQHFYTNKKFDMEIDTSKVSGHTAAESIIDRLRERKSLSK